MANENGNSITPVDYNVCEQEATYRLLDTKVLEDLKRAMSRAAGTATPGDNDQQLACKAAAG